MRKFLLVVGTVLGLVGFAFGFSILLALGMSWVADYIYSDMTPSEKFDALYYAETSPAPVLHLGPLAIGHGLFCAVLFAAGLACLYAAHRIKKSTFTSPLPLGR